MIKAALIGFGGIAQGAHLPAYQRLEEEGRVKLVAACDIAPERFEKKVDINIGKAVSASEDMKTFTDLEEMLGACEIDLVDICLPTHLHADMAIAMLEREYNVISEKPMARTYEDTKRMLKAAKKADGKLMIGQCLRFFPEYVCLKDAVERQTFGKVISARFSRVSNPPVWGSDNWFMDVDKSGGCLLDMHIHDIDMARWLFGEPKSVSCDISDVYSGKDIVYSRLNYDGFSVQALGDWSLEGANFEYGYVAAFEKATLICQGGKVMVYPRDGAAYEAELISGTGVYGELSYFLDVIEGKYENITNPPASASKTVSLIETLEESSRNGGVPIAFQ